MAGRVATQVAVVGAGYAGLACAVELADAGFRVDVFEASRTLGGRARRVDANGLTLDNGAHILVGAYRETLRLMEKVGAGQPQADASPVGGSERFLRAWGANKVGAGRTALKRTPLHLEYAGKVKIVAPHLPAPLHLAWALLTAKGLSWRDKFAALHFMRDIQARHFKLDRDITAAELFSGQPENLRRYFWDPLCLAALNTPVAIASAQVFLNVLRDSLAASRAASDLLLPATDFSSLFPDPAAAYIERKGCRVIRATRITTLARHGEKWSLNDTLFDHVVLAVAPYHLAPLLSPHPEFSHLLRQVAQLTWQPIATLYLAYPPRTRLAFPMVGLAGGHAHWLFDRGRLCNQPGLLAAVISGAGPWQMLTHDALAAAVHDEIAAYLPGLTAPARYWVIEEKRATYACTPNMKRPAPSTPAGNLWLAGDYVAGDYPATIEGAIRSGTRVARHILGNPTP